MHQFELAWRDFMNCEAAMRPGGHAFLHDVAPFNDDMTTRDLAYLDADRPWTGDVWKVLAVLREHRPDISVAIIAAHSTGLGCVSKHDPSNTVPRGHFDDILARFTDLALAEYGIDRHIEPTGCISPESFLARSAPHERPTRCIFFATGVLVGAPVAIRIGQD